VVPAQNLYRLLCYAWDWVEGMSLTDVGGVDSDKVEDLLASALLIGTRTLLRRGLDRSYVRYEEELAAPRGKLDISTTLRRALDRNGRAACTFDELDPDVLHNRILRSTMLRLSRTSGVDRYLVAELRRTADRMAGVREVELHASTFRSVQLHRNNAHYRFLLNVCELVTKHLVPIAHGSGYRFIDFRASSQVMGLVFEAFLRGFFRREQSHFAVRGESVEWAVGATSAGAERFLPAMRTDICLTSAASKVVIDAKLYEHPFATGRGGGRTLRSAHVYQLLAYLRNLDLNGQQRPADVGMLLYGTSGERFDLRYDLAEKDIRVRGLDLAQPWPLVRADLLEIAGSLRCTPGIEAHRLV
jgi:5-methylcytosine-specific restriction enzyme subunit McrC